MITLPFSRRLRVLAFFAFALLLFVGTHWPQLRIEGPISRPDLVVHLVAFGIWGLLFCLSGLVGEPGSLATAARGLGIGALYAAFDEASQAIPVLGRFAGLDDYTFNILGLLIGCSLSLLVRAKPEREPQRG